MELISRDEAKRKITEELDSIDHVPSWVFERLERVINSLPTVEEREEGRWEIQDIRNLYGKGYRLTCSECGETFDVTEHAFPYERYCRYCGARMRGE